MSELENPRNALFAGLKAYAGLNNGDLAKLVLQDNSSALGAPLAVKVKERTWLSREVVNVLPEASDRYAFNPFEQSVPTILGRLKKGTASKGKKTDAELIEHFSGEGARAMMDALEERRINSNVYENAVASVVNAQYSELDKATLLVGLYVVTGCTGSPQSGVNFVKSYAQVLAGKGMVTMAADQLTMQNKSQDAISLGLLRVEGTAIIGGVHRLSDGARGTEIGSLATSNDAITAVGPGVSRSHLIIWLDYDGKWYAEGRDSSNGTTLVRKDGEEVVIEPPRKDRAGWESEPVEIQPGDRLILAKHTEFLVMQVG